MEEMPASPNRGLQETRERWLLMSFYQRFEHIVAFALSGVIAIVIVVALLQLVLRVVPLLATGALDPLDHGVFQALFGMIMTVLIAMEFKHSIIRVALRRDSFVQVKTVVLIALIALSRKFVILDSGATAPSSASTTRCSSSPACGSCSAGTWSTAAGLHSARGGVRRPAGG